MRLNRPVRKPIGFRTGLINGDINMKIIGLTGSSGSGKSAVSRIFEKNGGYVIDADRIAHENIKKGNPAYNELKLSFGNDILFSNEEIDRKKLGELVFSDKEKLKLLNEISFKYIFEKISEKMDYIIKNPGDYRFIVIDAPLLIETGLNSISSEVWLICADEKIRLERIIKRDNIDISYAAKRLNNQTPQKELIPFADIIIENNYISIEDLEKTVLEKLKT